MESNDYKKGIIPPGIITEHGKEVYRSVSEFQKTGQLTKLYPNTGRNEKCPCDSGKKFKKCCGK